MQKKTKIQINKKIIPKSNCKGLIYIKSNSMGIGGVVDSQYGGNIDLITTKI